LVRGVLKFVCCTVLMMICSTVNTLSGLGGERFYGNSLLLFSGTNSYIQLTMMAMGSNNIRVKNNPFCGVRAFLTEIYTPIYKDYYPPNRTNWSFLMLRC